MATIRTCDVCKEVRGQGQLLKVQVPMGDHPHKGDLMLDTIDLCTICLAKIPAAVLRIDAELDEIIRATGR